MKLCDMHTHSDNSFDAKSTVDELCQAALDKGLYAIAVPQKKNTRTDCSF